MAAVSATVQATLHSGVSMLAHGATAFGSLILLMFWFPGLALLTASITLCGAMIALVHASREAALSGAALRISSEQQELMHVALSSLPALRALGATERVLARHTSILGRHALASVQQEGARSARDLALRASEDSLALLTLGWLAYRALSGAASIGDVMTASLLGANFTRAAKNLADLALSLRAMRSHFAQIDALLDSTKPSLPGRGAAPPTALVSGEPRIALTGVWFRYDPSSPYVLKNYSREFPTNQVSRLEAESGFGKTTILRLLSGLLVPEHGHVSVLGHDPAACRDRVAYLPQQSTLFEASIALNLKALSGESLQRVLEIAELTGLTSLLERLPMGIETPVSAGGGNLSAGQQQLIRLTAVFACRRPVVLLDEPTSRLDDVAKARIDWPRLVRDRTVVLVEHAMSRSVSSLQSFPHGASEGVRFGGVR
jgi:ABC-type bacteriocin/lantibiotic exporter with double-glycine peptidase domain